MKKYLGIVGAVALFVLAPNLAYAQGTVCGKTTYTLQTLRISSVTGSAVNALNAGDVTCGGFLVSPNATICVNQNGSAGTSSTGDTSCVPANTPFYLAPSPKAVSVNSTTNPATLAGNGYH